MLVTKRIFSKKGSFTWSLILSLFIHLIILFSFKNSILITDDFKKSTTEKISVNLVELKVNRKKKKENIKSEKINSIKVIKPVFNRFKKKYNTLLNFSKLIDKKKIIKKLNNLLTKNNISPKKLIHKVHKKIKRKKKSKNIRKKYINKRKNKTFSSKLINGKGKNGNKKSKISLFSLKIPKPEYPIFSRKYGEEGVVIIMVLFDKYGNFQKSYIEQSSGYTRIDRAALKASKKIRIINRQKLNFNLLILKKRIKFKFKLR